MAPRVLNGHVPDDVRWPYCRRAGALRPVGGCALRALFIVSSVFWGCCFGDMKDIRPIWACCCSSSKMFSVEELWLPFCPLPQILPCRRHKSVLHKKKHSPNSNACCWLTLLSWWNAVTVSSDVWNQAPRRPSQMSSAHRQLFVNRQRLQNTHLYFTKHGSTKLKNNNNTNTHTKWRSLWLYPGVLSYTEHCQQLLLNWKAGTIFFAICIDWL